MSEILTHESQKNWQHIQRKPSGILGLYSVGLSPTDNSWKEWISDGIP